MYFNEIENGINRCKHLIRNWDAIEGLNLDFAEVEIDGLLVDKREDDKDEGLEISLLTTIYTITTIDERDVYSVRWRFKDLWGNLAFFQLNGHRTVGNLCLKSIDYDDFAIVGFSIIDYYDKTIFKFDEPDEISIVSVMWKAHQTIKDLDPEDFDI